MLKRVWARRALVSLAMVAAFGAAGPGLASAQPRGQGTMLVRQSTDCSGSGNASTVSVPFSVLFTGFAPNATGTVVAYTQPGGVEVGRRTITVGPDDQLRAGHR